MSFFSYDLKNKNRIAMVWNRTKWNRKMYLYICWRQITKYCNRTKKIVIRYLCNWNSVWRRWARASSKPCRLCLWILNLHVWIQTCFYCCVWSTKFYCFIQKYTRQTMVQSLSFDNMYRIMFIKLRAIQS